MSNNKSISGSNRFATEPVYKALLGCRKMVALHEKLLPKYVEFEFFISYSRTHGLMMAYEKEGVFVNHTYKAPLINCIVIIKNKGTLSLEDFLSCKL